MSSHKYECGIMSCFHEWQNCWKAYTGGTIVIFLVDSNVANPNVNISDDATSPNVNIDDNANEKIWKNERYNLMMYMKKILKIWNHTWLFSIWQCWYNLLACAFKTTIEPTIAQCFQIWSPWF